MSCIHKIITLKILPTHQSTTNSIYLVLFLVKALAIKTLLYVINNKILEQISGMNCKKQETLCFNKKSICVNNVIFCANNVICIKKKFTLVFDRIREV